MSAGSWKTCWHCFCVVFPAGCPTWEFSAQRTHLLFSRICYKHKRAALLWTRSIASLRVRWPGDKTLEAYSKAGLTKSLYVFSFALLQDVLMFLLMKPSVRLPVAAILETWWFQLRVDDIATPRQLAVLVAPSSSFFKMYGVMWGDLFLVTVMVSHLDGYTPCLFPYF